MVDNERIARRALEIAEELRQAEPTNTDFADGWQQRYLDRQEARLEQALEMARAEVGRCHEALMGREKCTHFCGAAQCNAGVAGRLPPLTAADRHAALGVLCHLPGNNSDEMLNAVLDELWAALNRASGVALPAKPLTDRECWEQGKPDSIDRAMAYEAGVRACADPDAWARTQWPEHQLHDNGSDTPLMALIRKVWAAAAGVTGRDGQTFSGNTPMVSGDSEANKEKG